MIKNNNEAGLELVPVQEVGGKQSVNARDLHEFLESKQDFSTWIKSRIKKYDFSEVAVFEVYHNSMENSKGGRPTNEYAISINMAKELSMVERNENGKLARQYFIQCEERLRSLPAPTKEQQILSVITMLQDDVKKLKGKSVVIL